MLDMVLGGAPVQAETSQTGPYSVRTGLRRSPAEPTSDYPLTCTVNTATLLWAFDFRLKQRADGTSIPIENLAFSDTANSHRKAFVDYRDSFPGQSD